MWFKWYKILRALNIHGLMFVLLFYFDEVLRCSANYMFRSHLKKETVITKNYMESIYVKEARDESRRHKLCRRYEWFQIVCGCRWLIRVETLHGFSRSIARRFGFPDDLSSLTSCTESKVYLQLPLIQLIDRGISAMAGHRGHMGYNDDTLSDNGGGYLPFNYVAIMGSRVLVS